MTSDGGPSLEAAPAGADALRDARAALFERARGGDAGAMDDLVRGLNPLLWHVARAQGLGTDEAADVVQTTWLELLRRLHEIRTPQALAGWLVTTTKREAWHARSRDRRAVHENTEALAELPAEHSDTPELVEAAHRRRVLWRHVQRLSDRCRELLRIVAFVDRPDYDVVSEGLGMPRGSIGPTRGRCLAKLRESLAADPAWEMP